MQYPHKEAPGAIPALSLFAKHCPAERISALTHQWNTPCGYFILRFPPVDPASPGKKSILPHPRNSLPPAPNHRSTRIPAEPGESIAQSFSPVLDTRIDNMVLHRSPIGPVRQQVIIQVQYAVHFKTVREIGAVKLATEITIAAYVELPRQIKKAAQWPPFLVSCLFRFVSRISSPNYNATAPERLSCTPLRCTCKTARPARSPGGGTAHHRSSATCR